MKIFDLLYAVSWALFIVLSMFTRSVIVALVTGIVAISMFMIDEWKFDKKIKDIEKKQDELNKK